MAEVSSMLYSVVQSHASEFQMVGIPGAAAVAYGGNETAEYGLWGHVIVRSVVRVDA